ncbi:MAG: ribokinase [Bryobacteraceae bacterium]|jgi:ribokinase
MERQGRIVIVGSANMDLVIPVGRLPRAGETLAGGDIALFPGGKGANQACAAARLGGSVVFLGQVGSDPFGSSLRASLQEAGVDTGQVGVAGRPTGCASIYVLPGGENAIVISPGANATLDPETAVGRLEALNHADFVLLQLEIPIETVDAALTWARLRGATTILDPAPARPLPPSLLRKVDFLTPNQLEAAILLGEPLREIRDFSDAEEAAAGLLALGPSTVVVKLGSLGCLVASGQTRVRIHGFPVAAVDTTAAGDAFNGGLAVALAEGRPPVEAAKFANAAGAIAVTRYGAQASLPSRDDLSLLLGPEVAV